MRILFINRMASMERGGGETFDTEIARHIAALGHEVTFLTGIPVFGKARLSIDNSIKNIKLRTPYFGWFPWDRVKGGWRVRTADLIMFEWSAARWAYKHRNEFDVIQICELPNLVVFLKSKIQNLKSKIPRVVVRLTAPNYYDPRSGIPLADGVIASGTSLAKLRKRGHERAVNIPNGVDVDLFYPHESSFRKAHGIAESETVFIYVARFQDFKNHEVLIKAYASCIKNHLNSRLVLAGSGPLLQQEQERAAALGVKDKVLFLGETSFRDLPEIYAAADIKVVSSDYESFCFAAIEAMSSGLPVVTTDCGWVPGLVGDTLEPVEVEWVDEGTDPPSGRFESETPGERIRYVPGGLVVGRNDDQSLSAAMEQMIGDASLRKRTGAWNREKAVREHGWNTSAEKLAAMYNTLLQTDSSSS